MNTVDQTTIELAAHFRKELQKWKKNLTLCIKFGQWEDARLSLINIEFYTNKIQKINEELINS